MIVLYDIKRKTLRLEGLPGEGLGGKEACGR